MPSAGSSRAEARPANSRATALTWRGQPRGAPLVTVQDARDLLAERLHRAARDRAAHPADPDLHHDAAAVDGHVRRRPLVIAVHPGGLRPQPGQATAPPRVLARTQITSPASSTSSMTSADNPENTIPTSSVTSIMTDRDTSAQPATTESATEPFVR